MRFLKIPLKQIVVGAAGADTIIDLPVGKYRFHRVIFVIGDTAAADVHGAAASALAGEINVELNGVNIGRITAARIDKIQSQYGAKFASRGVDGANNGEGRRHLTYHFAQPWRKKGDGEMFAVQTGHLNAATDTFQIRVKMATGITPAFTAYAICDEFSGGKPHALSMYETVELNKTGTPIEVNEINKADGVLSQISIFDPSGGQTIDRVRLEQDGTTLFDMDKNANNTELENGGEMVSASGIFPLVFDLDDALQDLIPAQNLQATLTPSAAATGTTGIVLHRIAVPK